MDKEAFRCNFPEFTDESAYPDSLLDFWAVVAEGIVDDCRWGDMRDNALGLVLAHYVSLAIADQQAAIKGAIPGTNNGAVTQKKVGEASVSYDAINNSESGAGQWNKTTYGVRYISLTKLIGAGCVQL